MKQIMVSLALAGALTACAHGPMRGSVAMKAGEREAHVCMNDDEVKPGDQVQLFRNVCTGGSGTGSESVDVSRSCEKTPLGRGTVTRTLNRHYSVVEFDEGVKFGEGDFVEKL